MRYSKFKIAIASSSGLNFIEVVACDMVAAHADIYDAYGYEVEIVSTQII